MKKLNIEHIGANVTITNQITFGNKDAFQSTLHHQIWLSKGKNGKYTIDDIEFMDITDVKFLGIDIEEGYKGYQNFKEQMLKMGIDINQLTQDIADEIITPQLKQQILNMFNKK